MQSLIKTMAFGVVVLSIGCSAFKSGDQVLKLQGTSSKGYNSASEYVNVNEAEIVVDANAHTMAVTGTCLTSQPTHIVYWEFRKSSFTRNFVAGPCAAGRFSFQISVPTENLTSGVGNLKMQMVGIDARGIQYAGEHDITDITFGGSSSGGGGCSDPFTANFCANGANPPDVRGVIQRLAGQYPNEFARCERNNDDFLQIVWDELRGTDRRWGSNWVRGNIGDSNGDVIGYYYGPGAPQEDSPYTVIIDVVGSCGGDESVAWQVYKPNNCCQPDGSAKWTSRPIR